MSAFIDANSPVRAILKFASLSICLIAGVFGAHASETTPSLLETAWDAAAEEATWRTPYLRERETVRDTMTNLARAAPACDPNVQTAEQQRLAAVDLLLSKEQIGSTEFWLIQEGEEHRGAGLFAVRCGEASPRVLQAPHAFYDLDTRHVVRSLFVETNARAAMWNTVHRYRATPDEEQSDEVHPGDVTREFGSLFHAATIGMAVGDPGLMFIQLHGFGSGSHDGDIIVSTGRANVPPRALAAQLRAGFGDVSAFGDDATVLGGTKNVQGRALSEWPYRRFLHVEMARDVRAQLRTETSLRATFSSALSEAGW